MLAYNIPASITLAQGMLESECGTSSLARYANNHFGIKCHEDWTGPYYIYDDDARGEHFRKYQTVDESYKDHALFLKARPWYSFLFNYSRTNYRDWAKGLAKAGYATASDYSQQLIFIIEENRLYELDTVLQNLKGYSLLYEQSPHYSPKVQYDYVVIKPGDCIYKIARQYNMDANFLCRINGLTINQALVPGQRFYLKRRTTSGRPYKGNTNTDNNLSVLPKKTNTPKG
jgi:hypothetical protein